MAHILYEFIMYCLIFSLSFSYFENPFTYYTIYIVPYCVFMLKHGGQLSIQDKEGLSVLDITMKDRPAHVVFRNTGNLIQIPYLCYNSL